MPVDREVAGPMIKPRLHAAPLAGISDRHYRFFLRCISPRVVVWSEMTWDCTILEAEKAGTLEAVVGFSEAEHPVVLQLAGSEPATLARAAKLGVDRGYDEVNLNCGCPAGQGGEVRACYGARLMLEPTRVAACCSAIRAAIGPSIPISVKCRLGVDGRDTYANLVEFVSTVAQSGAASHFVVVRSPRTPVFATASLKDPRSCSRENSMLVWPCSISTRTAIIRSRRFITIGSSSSAEISPPSHSR